MQEFLNSSTSMSKFKKIYLERTSGYIGNGGVYKLFITSKGNVHLTQEFHFGLEKKMRKWKIDQDAIDKLDKLIERYGFFNLKEKEATYSGCDFPFCVTKIDHEEGIRRKIEHYLGDDSWPKELTSIENGIEKIAGVKEYYDANSDV